MNPFRVSPVTCRLLAVLALGLGAERGHAANLAPDAAYEVTVSGYVYPGQILPGSNTRSTQQGYMDAPPWSGAPTALTDGRRDGPAVFSWFWDSMPKRITVRFDLRRTANVTGLRAWPRDGSPALGGGHARLAATRERLSSATVVNLDGSESGVVWTGAAEGVRFVEVTVSCPAPQMSLAEVEIEGEFTGEVAADSPPPGLRAPAARDLAALVALPPQPDTTANLARSGKARVITVTTRADDVGATVDSAAAAALIDGERDGGVRSVRGWFETKRIRVDLDLGQPAQVERLVLWSSGHGGADRSFINGATLWLQAAEGAPWEPAGELWNPLLPGDVPASAYPLTSPRLDRPVRRVRLELVGVAQSADVMQLGEVEIWGRPLADAPAVPPWRVTKPVPEIAPTPAGEPAAPYDWLRRERLRGLYAYVGNWRNTNLVERSKAAGFNCMIVHTMGKSHTEEGWPPEAAAWARLEAEHGLRVVIAWPFGADERYGNTLFGAYQPGGPLIWKRGPCPQSEDYWNRVVGDRAEIAARTGLTGFVVDMEMYTADATRYPGPCYCDSCWGGFVAGHLEGVEAAEVLLRDRPAWISGNGLVDAYARRQELKVMAILQAIRQRVRTINPHFLLGNLLDAESLPGLARGFGTPDMPALVFSELEYHGAIGGLPGRLESLRRQGYPVWYVPGFWIRPVTPPQLPALVAEAAPWSGGYWLWTSYSLTSNGKGEYALAEGFSREDYWQAFRRANDGLTAALQSNAPPPVVDAGSGPEAVVPRLDGPLPTPADWDRAASLGPFVSNKDGTPAKAPTEARALWDGRRLHLRLVCSEPELAGLAPPQGERDDPDLWLQESIEVFWRMPGADAYAHAIVNTAGTVSDAVSDGIRPENPGWNADITATASRRDGAWELLLSIRLDDAALGRFEEEQGVKFELVRNRVNKIAGRETTCWAPTGGMFRGAPNRWGTLRLR